MNPLLILKDSGALAVIAFLVALTISSTMDYHDAQLAEKSLCKHNPQPEFCGEPK